jgi:hypothetical protein
MPISIPEFWRLLVESSLLTSEEAAKLADEFSASPEAAQATSDKLAQWLYVARKLSPYQGRILLAGRPGPFVYGDYQIYDRIESGRLAGIFRALHIPTRHRVCLFFLSGTAINDPEIMARLSQEALAANRASVGHPHLHRCYHLADEGAYRFIVMEDLQGKRVERLLATQGALPPAEACRIAREAALGLARLHAMGQVHGEIRPANIWVDARGPIKLLLFPLSRDPLAPPGPLTGYKKGGKLPPQADYLAPEQAKREPTVDARGDIYSLGCSLYHMLANQAPFAGGDLRQKLARHVSQKPVPLDEINSAIPAGLAKLVNYMMAKDPDMRYQQANSVVEALLPFLAEGAGQTEPRPPSRASRHYEVWLKRRLGDAAAAVAATPGVAPEQAAAPVAAAAIAPSAPVAQAAPVVQAAPVMAAPVVATPVQAMPVQATPLQAVPAQAVPVSAVPIGGAHFGSAPVASPMVARAMVAEPVAVQAFPQAAMAAPGPAFAAAAMHDQLPASTSALRSRRPAKRGNRGLMIVMLLLLVGGTVAGGLWQAGLLKSVIANSQVKDKVDGAATPAKEVAAANVVKKSDTTATENPKAAEPVKPQDVVWALDDGIWESPTSGKPLDLKYLAPGSQAIVALRPAELLKQSEGEKLLDARTSGILGEWVQKDLPATSGSKLENIEQVIVGFVDDGMSPIRLALVVRMTEAPPQEELLKAWGDPATEKAGDQQFYHKDDRAYFLPKAGAGKILVVAPKKEMPDMIAADGAPFLRLEMEYLANKTDGDRQFTLLLAPSFLSSASKSMSPPTLRLKDALETFLIGRGSEAETEEPKALALSAHLAGDTLFTEMRVFSSESGAQATGLAQAFRDRVHKLHKKVTLEVRGLDWTPYSEKILIDFPDMVEEWTKYTRVGTAEKQVVLRTYLPAKAAHNLALGTYLAVLENPRGAAVPGVVTVANGVGKDPQGAAERLKKKTSLAFPRNTLEKSMELLAEDIGVPITILGNDLMIDGITKNQSFGLDEREKPALEILHKILKQANPDGKLIYIIKPKKEGGGEEIFLTTRAAVEKRGDKLTPDMMPEDKPKKK